jgi:hypothetical protein
MRTDIKGVDAGARFFQFVLDVTMQDVHLGEGEKAPCHPGLVGHDDHQKTGLPEMPNRIGDPGNELEILDSMKIILFDIQGSITVDENCPAGGFREE